MYNLDSIKEYTKMSLDELKKLNKTLSDIKILIAIAYIMVMIKWFT